MVTFCERSCETKDLHSLLGRFLWIFYPTGLYYTKIIIPLSVNG